MLKTGLFILIFCLACIEIYSFNSNPKIPSNSFLGGPCCCGANRELNFNNFDFESPPLAPPGGWIDYAAGQMYDGWTVTSGSISIHHATHGNMGAGNPNGASQHMDLHGGTPGSVSYPLTGLTAGYTYTIELWYAIHISAPSATANLKIEGGAWLNVSWTAFNKGDALWLKASYMFIAKGSSTNLELIGSGPLAWGGMLIDDIHIYECPGDNEEPKASSIPADLKLTCIKDLPPAETITFTDNCDVDPLISFVEKIQGPICDQTITRTWSASDKCGNTNELIQKITIKDDEPPIFTKIAIDTIVYCPSNVDSIFDAYLLRHGGALAADNCNVDHWNNIYNHKPRSYCDTSIIDFIVYDACLNSNSIPIEFIVSDTSSPKLSPAIDVQLNCNANGKDSLAKWLDHHAYATANDNCSGSLTWKNNFNGDSLASEIKVKFTVSDACGNSSETTGVFKQNSSQSQTQVNITKCHLAKEYSDTITYIRPSCDSVVITTYHPARQDLNYFQSPTCDSILSGTDTIFLTNTEFCDSIIINDRPFIAQKISVETIYDCSVSNELRDSTSFIQLPCDSIHIKIRLPAKSMASNAKNYTCDINKQGIDSIYFMNQHGCDSLVVVETIYNKNVQTDIDTNICGLLIEHSDSILLKGQYCDSLVVTNFHKLKSDTTQLINKTCDLSQSGKFISHLINSVGCDSMIIENIVFSPSDTLHTTSITCDPPISVYDTTHLKNKNGCDSIIIHFNNYIKKDSTYLNAFTCDPSKSGTFYSILQGRNCDSILIQNVLLKYPDTSRIESLTCHLAEVKSEIKYIPRTNDCDSIVLIKTIYAQPSLQILSQDITCYKLNDGKIWIDKIANLQSPLRYFLNNNEISDPKDLQNLSKGDYSFFVQDSNGCISDSINFVIREPDSLYVQLGSDITLSNAQQILLSSSSNGNNLKYQWSPSSIFDCPDCDKSNAHIDSTTLVILSIEDKNGCTAKDEILIQLLKNSNVWAPNIISPNGDNINDYFYIQGDDQAIVELMQIFDRWGNLVFETQNIPVNDPSKGWDGSFKGKKLNPAVFVYFAKIKLNQLGTIELKGDLTLLK